MSVINFNRSSVPLVLGFLLLASGSVFLVENLTDTTAWSAILPWWPILLLVMGGWAIARGAANQLRGETASVWLWFGEAVFALLIIGAGLAANFLTTTDWDLGFLEPPLVTTTKTVARTIDFNGDRLIVANPSGRIKVIGWERPHAQVSLKMTSGGATLRSARRRLDKESELIIKDTKGSLHFRVKKQSLEKTGGKVSELTIRMPKAAAARLRAYGRVYVAGTEGPVDVASQVGRITLDGLAGPVKARNELGDIKITDAGGDLDIRNATGMIKVDKAGGPITAYNEGGSIFVFESKADIKANTLGGTIEIADPGGAVAANTRAAAGGGQVTISAKRAPAGEWRVRSEIGPIIIQLPRAAGFTLDAISEFGQLETNFFNHRGREPGTGDKINRPVNNGGPLVHLRTNNGNINVMAVE